MEIFNFCKDICNNVTNVRLRRSDGSSPLLLALHKCQLKMDKLLIENDLDNIRADVFSSRDLKFWLLVPFVFDLIVLLISIITYELWVFHIKKCSQVCKFHDYFCAYNTCINIEAILPPDRVFEDMSRIVTGHSYVNG